MDVEDTLVETIPPEERRDITMGVSETLVETIPPAEHRNIHDSIHYMAIHPRKGDRLFKDIKEALDKIQDLQTLLGDADRRQGETVLHTAVKRLLFKTEKEKRVVEIFIEKFPKLILCDRLETVYEGQTPLHMAICKGSIWLVTTLLLELSKHVDTSWKNTVLRRQARGPIFHNTVMLGQLPLSIAALTFNKEMIDVLLNDGAQLDGTNSLGDNVCHSLIRYGHLYPDKKNDVIDICRKLVEEPTPFDTSNKAIRKLRKKILLMENKDGLNALQLSVKLGFHEMFAFIMDQEPYCHTNSNDGLFDIKIYDVTEIDAVSFLKESDHFHDNKVIPVNTSGQQPKNGTKKMDRSILMTLFDLDPDVAFQIIQFPPVRIVVNRKWNAYRKYFYPFWIFYFVFICFLTLYSVERSRQSPNSPTGYDVAVAPAYLRQIGELSFVTAFGIIGFVVGTAFIAQELFRIAKRRMPWTLKSLINPYGCGFFRIMFCMLGVGLIVDFCLALTLAWYENYVLIISVILGWFLHIFFIRALKPFSFFTVLIQNVLLGDMFRFFVIIGIELAAFATAMYMAIQGSNSADDPNYSNIWRVLFSMFTLMVGLGDMADFYQTRKPLLCVAIFIGFVVMTTLLMINGLIAMMSRTCTELVENVGNTRARDRHSKLQRLSVILFLESIFVTSQIEKVGKAESMLRYHTGSNRRRKEKRFMLELRSLQSEDDDDTDESSVTPSSGFRTVINAIRQHQRESKQRPSSGISDRLKNFFKRKEARSDERKGVNMTEGNTMEMPYGLPVVKNGNNIPREIDIYHINRCESCQEHEVIRS